MADEIGLEEKTPHTHVYILFHNPVSFNSMKNKFNGAHLDAVKGKPAQVRDYIQKGGKWEHHDKVETKVDGTFEEVGDCPNYKQGERTDLQFLYNQIEQGLFTSDIINENPKFMLRMTEIERVRQMLLENKYKNTFRNLNVTYIWGDENKACEYYIGEPKNRKHRAFPTSDEIKTLLNKVKTIQEKYGIVSEYVFANKEGRVNSHTISCAMSRRCKDAGIDTRSIHAIRRTVSSHLRAVLPVATVANMLGHLEETNNKHYNYDIITDELKATCLKEMYKTFKKVA